MEKSHMIISEFMSALQSFGTKIKQTKQQRVPHLLLVYRPTGPMTDDWTAKLAFPRRATSCLRRRCRRPQRFRSSLPPCGQTGCWGSPPATPCGSSSLPSPRCTCGHGSWAPRTAPSCCGGNPEFLRIQLYCGIS